MEWKRVLSTLPFDANCTDVLLHSVIACMQHLLHLHAQHTKEMHDNVLVCNMTLAVCGELNLRQCLHQNAFEENVFEIVYSVHRITVFTLIRFSTLEMDTCLCAKRQHRQACDCRVWFNAR